MVRDRTRRDVLKLIGVSGASLRFAGPATATDGRARYIAETGGDASKKIKSAGFEILTELADSSVVLVKGPEDAADDLGRVQGVSSALPDFAVEYEGPDVPAEDVGAAFDDVDADDVYDEFLWDISTSTSYGAFQGQLTHTASTTCKRDNRVDR